MGSTVLAVFLTEKFIFSVTIFILALQLFQAPVEGYAVGNMVEA
jgi:hypothetical protein